MKAFLRDFRSSGSGYRWLQYAPVELSSGELVPTSEPKNLMLLWLLFSQEQLSFKYMQTDNAISKFIETCFTGYFIIFRSMGKTFFYRVFEAYIDSIQERFRDYPLEMFKIFFG
jgi:hypothetical protein